MPRPIKDEGERRRVHGPLQPLDDRAYRARAWRIILPALAAFWIAVGCGLFALFN